MLFPTGTVFDKSDTTVWDSAIQSLPSYDSAHTTLWAWDELTPDFFDTYMLTANRPSMYSRTNPNGYVHDTNGNIVVDSNGYTISDNTITDYKGVQYLLNYLTSIPKYINATFFNYHKEGYYTENGHRSITGLTSSSDGELYDDHSGVTARVSFLAHYNSWDTTIKWDGSTIPAYQNFVGGKNRGGGVYPCGFGIDYTNNRVYVNGLDSISSARYSSLPIDLVAGRAYRIEINMPGGPSRTFTGTITDLETGVAYAIPQSNSQSSHFFYDAVGMYVCSTLTAYGWFMWDLYVKVGSTVMWDTTLVEPYTNNGTLPINQASDIGVNGATKHVESFNVKIGNDVVGQRTAEQDVKIVKYLDGRKFPAGEE